LDVLDDPDTYRPLLSDSTSAAFSLLDADFDDLRSQAENCPDCDAAQALLTNLVESRQAETIALLEMAE
jgi:thiol-disulfide isomerase/thioredoxin